MIVDGHAHAFPYVGGAGMFKSVEEHLRYLQVNMSLHPQGGRRFRDNVLVKEPTLWDGKTPGLKGLLPVNFRVGRFGRFEWEKDGEAYYIQFFPPTLDDMVAAPERMLAQMQYVGVDKALLQFAKIYGITNEYMSGVVRTYPGKFRCCTAVDENNADKPEQIEALRHAVKDLGITALYYAAPSTGENRLDDEKYVPFWEEVDRLGIPVVWDIRSAAKRWDHGFYMDQAVRLHRHLKRFPQIRNVLSHGMPANAFEAGGRMPDALWAMLKEPNIVVELLFPLLYGGQWDYPYAEAQPIIRQLYETLGPSKLLWGADMPNVERSCTYRQSLDYLRKYCTFIRESDLERILGQNALEIYFAIAPAGMGK